MSAGGDALVAPINVESFREMAAKFMSDQLPADTTVDLLVNMRSSRDWRFFHKNKNEITLCRIMEHGVAIAEFVRVIFINEDSPVQFVQEIVIDDRL